jgi:hypothetical protein
MAKRLKNVTTRPFIGNPPWIHAPWVELSYRVIITERDQVIRDANWITRVGITSLYLDTSVAVRLTAIAVVKRDGECVIVVCQESIGWVSICSILTAEIAAISAALSYT